MKNKICLIMALILAITGCNNKDSINIPKEPNNENTEEIEPIEDKTIIYNEYGYMNNGNYQLLFDGELELKVNDDYIIDEFAISFEDDINLSYERISNISGEFRYKCGEDNCITKLNTINADFFYMGEKSSDSFQLTIKEDKVYYWLYSKREATLTINKIWKGDK